MNSNYDFYEQLLIDILLCEPITCKGLRALGRLQLEENITRDFFYKELYANSHFSGEYFIEDKFPETEFDNYEMPDDEVEYERTLFYKIKNNYSGFNGRLTSGLQNQSPLLIIGVAGNGKSIEINRVLNNYFNDLGDAAGDYVYFDLEKSFPDFLTYGTKFRIKEEEKNDVRWFLCLVLMQEIMEYINNHYSDRQKIRKNFFTDIASCEAADKELYPLFIAIGDWDINGENNKRLGDIFIQLIKLTENREINNIIQDLLEILFFIMYCAKPKKRHFIVFDNIEQYVLLNDSRIQISDSQLKKIWNLIKNCTSNTIKSFNERIGKRTGFLNLGWHSFKVILVSRRTSLNEICPSILHSPLKEHKNAIDLTGHFQLYDIWEKKKNVVWECLLKPQYETDTGEFEDIVRLCDFVMNEGRGAIGKSYQDLITPLVSHGIRRNAIATSHAIIEMYKQLNSGDISVVSYENFDNIELASLRYEARYMMRRALMEAHFKWMISNADCTERWKNLGIGHLAEQKGSPASLPFVIKRNPRNGISRIPVRYFDENNVSLVRRVLSFLSRFQETVPERFNKPVVSMYLTKSFHELVTGVMTCPGSQNSNDITEEKLIPLARVLIALADMSQTETKGAPYVILGIKKDDHIHQFHDYPSAESLAELLYKIWKAGKHTSTKANIFNSKNYGIRITDAGYSFLKNWQASFSFMAALYCHRLPSLFYLREIKEIKYIISSVYGFANMLCKKYEDEAKALCTNKSMFVLGEYLPEFINEDEKMYRGQVKKYHIRHLTLYKLYVEKYWSLLGGNVEQQTEIIDFVESYINKYHGWKTEGDDYICF